MAQVAGLDTVATESPGLLIERLGRCPLMVCALDIWNPKLRVRLEPSQPASINIQYGPLGLVSERRSITAACLATSTSLRFGRGSVVVARRMRSVAAAAAASETSGSHMS